VPRVPVVLLAVSLAAVVLASPTTIEAKPQDPKPRPTPTAKPTPTPTPSSGASVEGIDVSYHQGSIDWPRVASAGKRFAFVRATAGTLTADSAYAANRAGARAAGLAVGSYHFANPDRATNDALSEAAWFLQKAAVESGDLLPVLDLEVANGLTSTELLAWAQTWLAEVSSATGVRPIIYTTPNFWSSSMANTEWFARNGYPVLWIAHWTTAGSPTVPAANWGGNGWSLWQYSSTGSVPGISGPVDLDRVNGLALPGMLFVP
jgi:GH25 family lysozyme M1 (1,4-beta-N-acetylmuramidase)